MIVDTMGVTFVVRLEMTIENTEGFVRFPVTLETVSVKTKDSVSPVAS